MTKSMKLFLHMQENGIPVTLENLDQMYEKEFKELLAIQRNNLMVNMESELRYAQLIPEYQKLTEEYRKGFVDGLVRCVKYTREWMNNL